MPVTAKTKPAQPIAWALRDEMAMRLVVAMIASNAFEAPAEDGNTDRIRTISAFSKGAYAFADAMLAAREVG